MEDYYTLIDYYAILGVNSKATFEEIREAYIELAIKNHPDNILYEENDNNEDPNGHLVNNGKYYQYFPNPQASSSAEEQKKRRKLAEKRFQQINQAYFILSDPERRKIYDEQYTEYCDLIHTQFDSSNSTTTTKKCKKNDKANTLHKYEKEANADKVFGGVFEELFKPDIPHPHTFWKPLGGAAGIVLGFICMNIAGAVAGGLLGSQLGKIRDNKGCSVYDAFKKLDKGKKAEILAELTKEVVQRAANIKK